MASIPRGMARLESERTIFHLRPQGRRNAQHVAGGRPSQKEASLPGHHFEGGWEQIVFNVERADTRHHALLYYPMSDRSGKLGKPLNQEEVNGLTASMSAPQKAEFFESHVALRHTINHPNISGPFDTGWGYSELDGDGMYDRIGLPALPGQTTTLRD